MSQLPPYLRYETNGCPRPETVVTWGDMRFTIITKELIRLEQGTFTDAATTVVLDRSFGSVTPVVKSEGSVLCIHTGKLTLRYDAALPLEAGLTIQRIEHPAFLWHWGQKPLQNLMGTASTLDCSSGEIPLQEGVCAIDGFALLDDSPSPCFDGEGWFTPRKPCSDMYFFGYGHDYTRAVQDFLRLTGVPPMLPGWALGNWWSRFYAYTADGYLALMDRFHEADIPLSVGIIDMDWHLTDGDGRSYTDGWTGYTWNRKLFPDPQAFLQELHKRGLKTALNLHPAQGVRPWEEQYEQMCAARGYDPKDQQPVPFFCLDKDYMKAYFEILHFPQEEDGVDFWWMDWQQKVDHKAIAGDSYQETGLDAITPLWMLNHAHFVAANRKKDQRALIFSRYAGPGTQRYPIGFSGDSYVTWGALKFQPYFTATASNIGYGWWSHDIGGHMSGIRDDELATRWVQLGVYSPIFRLHSSSNACNTREPWAHNLRAETIMTRCMRLRHQLYPYLYTMNWRSHRDLIPLVQPMYHVYPECTEAYQVPNQYFFGSEMMVCPITDPAGENDLAPADVWLPEGLWTDMENGYIYCGRQKVTVWRPLEEVPVFLKAGAILPMQQHIPGNNQLGLSNKMEITLAPGASNSFTLFEDDGASQAYLEGHYAQTTLSLQWQENHASFTIHPVAGERGMIPTREWALRLVGFKKGCTFTVGGQALPAVWNPEKCTYTLSLPLLAPTDEITVDMKNPRGLIHDNQDIKERYIRKLTRAQGPMHAKEHMLMRLNDAIEFLRTHPSLTVFVDQYPALEGMLKEMITQWKPE